MIYNFDKSVEAMRAARDGAPMFAPTAQRLAAASAEGIFEAGARKARYVPAPGYHFPEDRGILKSKKPLLPYGLGIGKPGRSVEVALERAYYRSPYDHMPSEWQGQPAAGELDGYQGGGLMGMSKRVARDGAGTIATLEGYEGGGLLGLGQQQALMAADTGPSDAPTLDWLFPVPGVNRRDGRGWVASVGVGGNAFVAYPDGRARRSVPPGTLRFVDFQKDYREERPYTFVVATDGFERVSVRLPLAIQLGLIIEAEGKVATANMGKTPAELAAIKKWLSRQDVLTQADNRKALDDSRRIACIYNTHDLLGVSPDTAAMMCAKDWWKTVLIGAAVVVGVPLALWTAVQIKRLRK